MGALPEEKQFLAVARIVRPQGRRGEVAAEILTDFLSRFEGLRRAYLENRGGPPEPVGLEKAWLHKGRIILKFAAVDSIEAAERLRGRHVLVPREDRVPLPEHHYYLWELTGCRVICEHDGALVNFGTVTEVERTGGPPLGGSEPQCGVDLLHVSTARGEVLIPLAQDICTRIDPEAKEIVVEPPEDLLELNLRERRFTQSRPSTSLRALSLPKGKDADEKS